MGTTFFLPDFKMCPFRGLKKNVSGGLLPPIVMNLILSP